MTFERVFSRITAVLGFLIFLAFAGTQFFVLHTAATVHHAIASVEDKAKPPFGLKIPITGMEIGDRHKPGYIALSHFAKLHSYRTVTVSIAVPLRELLEPGETLPERDFLDAFVTARAGRYALRECELLKSSFAKECGSNAVSGRTGREGYAAVNLSLLFTQADEFGAVEGDSAVYVEINETFHTSVGSLSPMAGERRRLGHYNKIREHCRKLVKSEGNCAIGDVFVQDLDAFGGGSRNASTASATFSSLVSN